MTAGEFCKWLSSNEKHKDYQLFIDGFNVSEFFEDGTGKTVTVDKHKKRIVLNTDDIEDSGLVDAEHRYFGEIEDDKE